MPSSQVSLVKEFIYAKKYCVWHGQREGHVYICDVRHTVYVLFAVSVYIV